MDFEDPMNFEPVYQFDEETMLPDWSKYNFPSPMDAIDWSILQGGILSASGIVSNLILNATAEDFQDEDFIQFLSDCQDEMLEMVSDARNWWKERER